MECSIINPVLLLLMKHLVTGQRQKAPDFSANFHWPPHGSLVFITTRVVHLPNRTAIGTAGHLTRKSGVLGPRFGSRSGNILSFLLPHFQEGQLSVTGESMCTKYWLTA